MTGLGLPDDVVVPPEVSERLPQEHELAFAPAVALPAAGFSLPAVPVLAGAVVVSLLYLAARGMLNRPAEVDAAISRVASDHLRGLPGEVRNAVISTMRTAAAGIQWSLGGLQNLVMSVVEAGLAAGRRAIDPNDSPAQLGPSPSAAAPRTAPMERT